VTKTSSAVLDFEDEGRGTLQAAKVEEIGFPRASRKESSSIDTLILAQ